MYLAHVRKSDEAIQRLDTHLSEVGKLSAKFSAKVDLPEAGQLLGLLHDFGKYSQAFQNYLNSAEGRIDPDADDYVDARSLKGKIDHSSAGAQHVFQLLRIFGKDGQGELCGQILALCIASHHSGLINCLAEDGSAYFCKRMQKSDAKTHLEECLVNADKALARDIADLAGKPLIRQMFGKIQHMVSLPKNMNETLRKVDVFILGMFVRFLFSCLVDADRLNSAEFENPARRTAREEAESWLDWNMAIERVENMLASFEQKHPIDEIRAKISNDCLKRAVDPQGIYTLTVPTGGGKTLASLRYALHHAAHHKLDRIIYIIPYTSIIEQNAGVVREILTAEGDLFPWVLEHHSNLDPSSQTWHAKLVAENWDAPIVFTTMVQFLETLFAGGTRSVRRMHQLANAVLIFDEIQTLPIKCVHMFCNSLNFLTQNTKTTAVLCTATQPLLDKLPSSENGELRLAPNAELVSNKYDLEESLRRVKVFNRIKPGGWSEEEIADTALNKLESSGSCLIVVNTKQWAQCLYLACKDHCAENSLFHLSTNQYPAHRRQLLNTIIQRLKSAEPVLCISTQLIEAGVDISFASVIRFLAGLDSIAQAAGRCNRHGELKDHHNLFISGQVEVINPDKESIEQLEDIRTGIEIAKRIFGECDQERILAPDTLERFFNYYFYQRAEQMVYPFKSERDDHLFNLLSNNALNIGRNHACLNKEGRLPLLKQSFRDAGAQFRAIDAPTQAVVVQHGAGKEIVNQLCALAKDFNPEMYYQTLKSAQQFSVNVFPNVWQKLQEQAAVHETQEGEGVYYLDSEYYSDEFGLSMTQVTSMETLSV